MLAGLAVVALAPVAVRALAADRLEGKDAQHERQVSEAGEEEEQGVQAFGRLAAAVEQDLRDAGAEVEDGADVAEDLAPGVEVQGRGLVVGVGVLVVVVVVGLGGGAEVVACDAGDDHEQDRGAVEEDCLGPGAWFGGFGGVRGGGGGVFRVHGLRWGEHVAVEAVEAVAVGGLGAGAVCFCGGAVGVAGREGSLQFATRAAICDQGRAL